MGALCDGARISAGITDIYSLKTFHCLQKIDVKGFNDNIFFQNFSSFVYSSKKRKQMNDLSTCIQMQQIYRLFFANGVGGRPGIFVRYLLSWWNTRAKHRNLHQNMVEFVTYQYYLNYSNSLLNRLSEVVEVSKIQTCQGNILHKILSWISWWAQLVTKMILIGLNIKNLKGSNFAGARALNWKFLVWNWYFGTKRAKLWPTLIQNLLLSSHFGRKSLFWPCRVFDIIISN